MEEKKKITEDMKTSTEELGGIVGLMERINRFVKKNGLKGTFTSLLTLFIAAVIGFFILNPGAFFEKFQDFSQQKHELAIKQRLEADPKIRTALAYFRAETGCDRAYILEAHNGGGNLNNLPFLYADLTYLEPKETYIYVEAEYKNFRLSRYPWASYVIERGFWFGPIEDCKELDPELFYRLKNEGVGYMGMYVMYGKSGLPSACLGIVFNELDETIEDAFEGDVKPKIEPYDKQTIIKAMQKYASLVNPYLINE